MPAGEAPPPRRVPLLLPLHPRRGELPEGEVGRVALGVHVLDPAAGGQLVEVEARELGVAREGGDVEVHAIVDDVGVASLLQRLHHGDLLVDVGGGSRHPVGLQAAETAPIGFPLGRVALGDLGRRLPRSGRRRLQLVVALVGVRDEVAHVGDVGDEGDLVAAGQQHAAQQIREELAAHVAQVLRRVDRGSTRVDRDGRRSQRGEGHQRSRSRVVQPQLLEARRRGFGHTSIMADPKIGRGQARTATER